MMWIILNKLRKYAWKYVILSSNIQSLSNNIINLLDFMINQIQQDGNMKSTRY